MDRAGFFRYLAARGASTAVDVVKHVINPLASLEDIKTTVRPLIPLSQYTARPQLLSASDPPLFLTGEPGADLRAVKATCEKDGFLLSYLPREEALFCPACNTKHALKRGDAAAGAGLPAYPVALDGDYICLIK